MPLLEREPLLSDLTLAVDRAGGGAGCVVAVLGEAAAHYRTALRWAGELDDAERAALLESLSRNEGRMTAFLQRVRHVPGCRAPFAARVPCFYRAPAARVRWGIVGATESPI